MIESGLIEGMLLGYAQDDMGVYPSAVVKNGIKTPRTEWQDGWNAYGCELRKNHAALVKWFESLDPRQQTILAEMLPERAVSLSVNDDRITMLFNASDLFAWGYSAYEEITSLEMLEELYEAWRNEADWGMSAWYCKQQNEKPQWPVEECMRKSGVWDAEMEALPANKYDEAIGRWSKRSRAEAIAKLEQEKQG